MPLIRGWTGHRRRPADLVLAMGLVLGAAWLGLLGRRQTPAATAATKPAPAPTTRPAAGDNFLEVKGVKIHYTVEGTGEPVVLIHGLYSSIEMNWRWPGTLAALAKDHRVIALDLPGHGKSDKPDRDDAYGQQMVEDVIALLDHLQLKKAHIVGYSMGGMVALKLIADHPDRVLSGTLGGMGWMREGGGLQKFWENLRGGRGGSTPPVCVRSLGKLAISEQALKAIKTPVAVVIGDRDPVRQLYVTPLEAVRKDWPVTEIPNAGHLNCIAKKEFIDAVVNWLAKNMQKTTKAQHP